VVLIHSLSLVFVLHAASILKYTSKGSICFTTSVLFADISSHLIFNSLLVILCRMNTNEDLAIGTSTLKM
jgi:hypothetical protein